jgi:TonB-dependent receptor
MTSRRLALTPASTAVLAILSAAFAQAVAAGDLTGRVTDGVTGRPLPNATVRIPALGRSVTADRAGDYRIDGVPAGTHAVEVEYVGFDKATMDVTVPESGAVAQAFSLSTGVAEEITVTGFRLAQAKALQDKRSSNVIKDSITADDAGKLPDQNAAEALSRVTGVSVTVDQGEGRYVTVRGIDPSLANVTLDNQIIGSPEPDTRRIALDTVPANLLAKLEVVKAVTPDMDGNAIGGSINIVTPSAFDDPDGHFASATVDVGYYDLNGKSPYGAALAYGSTFGAEKQWGIVLSGSYSDREFDSENFQGGDPWVEVEDDTGIFAPDNLTLRDYTIRRVRKGIVANLENQPNDDVKLYWRNLVNRFEDTELQAETIWDYRGGDLEDLTPTSGLFTEGEGERLISERFEVQQIQTSTLGGDFTLGAWSLGASVTVGKAKQDTPRDREWSFSVEELPMSYDTSDLFFTVDAGDEFHDPANYEFNEYARGGQIMEEDLRVAQIDLKRAMNFGSRTGSIKFGAKRIGREKTSDQDLVVYDGFEDDLTLEGFTDPGKSDFYSSEKRYEFGPKMNFGRLEDFYDGASAGFEANAPDTAAESFGVDYEIDEDVTAGYLMGTMELGRTTVIGGVRVEKTESDFTGYDVTFVDDDVEVTGTSGSKSYTNTLPGLQMRMAATDSLIVRAAWTNTIGRPSYETTVPFRIFETQEDEINDDGIMEFEGEIEMGNPDLDPLESMNLDASIEWYLEPAGIVSAGLFYKDIDNPIFNRFTFIEGEEFEGRLYSELIIARPENAEKGEIRGLELNFQQQFRGLPSPFDGLGVAVNYTYSDSEAEVFDRAEKTALFLQSDHVGNAALFFEKRGFEMRLAYTYRSKYLEALGDDASTDLYIDAHGKLDFKTSYGFSEHVTGFLQFQNITDEPLRMLSGTGRRLAENEIYSWNALAGVQIEF